MSFDIVWPLADIMNGLMALPNLIGLMGLSSVILIESKAFFALLDREKLHQREIEFTYSVQLTILHLACDWGILQAG